MVDCEPGDCHVKPGVVRVKVRVRDPCGHE